MVFGKRFGQGNGKAKARARPKAAGKATAATKAKRQTTPKKGDAADFVQTPKPSPRKRSPVTSPSSGSSASSALVVAEKPFDELVQCQLCGVSGGEMGAKGYYHKDCEAFKIRLGRTCPQEAGKQSGSFWCMKSETKEAFFRENRDKFKDDLRVAVSSTLDLELTQEEEFGLHGTGHMLDSPDLEEKYKNKPGRADLVKGSCRTFTCPRSKIKFYEDM